ncbi:hypothetical protein PO909_030698 [Leuciscus waleckii]
MFRQGSNSGNKRLASGARLSQPNIPVSLSPGSNKTQEMGRSSNDPLNAMGLDHTITAPGGDPEYIMQLVNDVRKFSDVLLSLKEAFRSKAEEMLTDPLNVWIQSVCTEIDHHTALLTSLTVILR